MLGIHAIENRGVIDEVKKVIAIDCIGIKSPEDIDIDELVELDMAMPDIVLDGFEEVVIDISIVDAVLEGAVDIDIDIDMSMLNCQAAISWVSKEIGPYLVTTLNFLNDDIQHCDRNKARTLDSTERRLYAAVILSYGQNQKTCSPSTSTSVTMFLIQLTPCQNGTNAPLEHVLSRFLPRMRRPKAEESIHHYHFRPNPMVRIY